MATLDARDHTPDAKVTKFISDDMLSGYNLTAEDSICNVVNRHNTGAGIEDIDELVEKNENK